MDRQTRKMRRVYYGLIVAFSVLIVLGLVNVFSSTFVGDRMIGNTYYHLIRQVIILFIGVVPALFVYRVDYTFWRRHLGIICFITVTLLVLVFIAGIHINGARRWLGIGFFTFQPSELAKLVGVIYTATILSQLLDKDKPVELVHAMSHKKKAPAWKRWKLKPERALWIPLVLAILVAKQPDAGTAIVILLIPVIMVIASGAHISKAKLPILVAVSMGLIYTLSAVYRRNRLISWIDPWSYEKTLGYQTVQGLIAIGSGGITGQGVGTGVSKFSYLPEAHTDFAFAIFAQEWGLIGSIVMLSLFAVIVYCGCMCALHALDKYGMLLALGSTLYIGGQGFINIGMVSGLLPVVGVPLPFISYGGTSLIVNMAAAALLLNIAKKNLNEAAREAQMSARVTTLPSMKEETKSQFPLH